MTVAANGSLNCAVSTAQDTDYFSLTPVIEGVQDLLSPIDDSGDLSYAWSGPGTFSDPASPSTNWTAPSTVTIGNTATLTCTITDNGDSLGPFDIGTKIDKQVTQHVAVTYVAGGSSSLTPSLTVNNCESWDPNPAYVGDAIHGTVTSTLSPGNLDSDGSGPTFVTYDWETRNVYESDDGGATIPFTDATNRTSYVIVWQPGDSSATFNATFFDPGYYILQVNCTANVCDSSTGTVIASAVATGYVGGDASDIPTSAGGSSADGLVSPDDNNGAGMPVQGVTIICNNTTIAAPKGKIKTVTVSEGQKVTLEAKLGNSDAPSCTWTIPGTAVANYNPGADDANLTELPKPPTQPKFSFYWTSSGTYTVSVSVPETITNADGTTTTKDVPASGTVTVKPLPQFTFNATTGGTAKLGGKDPAGDETMVMSGQTWPINNDSVGIIFTAVFPNNDDGDSGSNTEFVQVIDSAQEKDIYPTSTIMQAPYGITPPGLDVSYPYQTKQQALDGFGNPVTPDTWITEDRPASGIPGDISSINRTDCYTMWLMWRCSSDGIWIPLKGISWGWNATATSNGQPPTFTVTGMQTQGDATTDAAECIKDGEPNWTRNAHPYSR